MEIAVTPTGLDADFVVRRSDTFALDISLSIPPGRTVALLGPNGAGKSTAVSAIAGLLSISTGHIALNGITLDDGHDTFILPERRKVGVVFQDYLLFPHLNVINNVAFGLRCRGIGRDEAISRSTEWLTRLDLDGLQRRKPAGLSGGQAQRVALARALVTEPAALLLDEPLSALDVSTRAELRHLLAEHLSHFQGPRLVITHDPVEAFLLADDIHIIENGSVTQTGTAAEIQLRPNTPYAAAVAGANLIPGTARDGVVDTGGRLLNIADDSVSGPVLVTILPSAVAVHLQHPGGSPRNTWRASIERLENLGGRVRFRTNAPLPLTVEITEAARSELELSPNSDVWVTIKATEIDVRPDQPADTDGRP